MGNQDKKAEEVDGKSVAEVQDSLNDSNALEGTDDSNEKSRKKQNRKKRSDRADVSSHDHISETDRSDTSERGKSKGAPKKRKKKTLTEEPEGNRKKTSKEGQKRPSGKEQKKEYRDSPVSDGWDGDEEDEMEKKGTGRKRRKKGKKNKKSWKIAAIVFGSVLGVLVLAYVGIAMYFDSHFLFFTKINGMDFSMKDIKQVEEYMEKQVSDYTLTLEKSGGEQEKINGNDIGIKYVSGKQLKKLMEEQDNFLWIKSLWEHPEIEAEMGVEYDEAALGGVVSNLACMNPENQTASVDAYPAFQEGQFVVVPEVVGTQLNMEVFNAKIAEAINGFQPTLNLSEAECYLKPRFVSDSPEVVAAKDAMNSYLGANITYDFNPNTEVVDASVISQWVRADGEMNVTFDEGAVRAFVQSLADKYDTKGKPRSFTTATGNVVTVEGGSYGWKIDQEAEYNALIANIQNAETVTREANYASRGASHSGNDVGSTYAEVDLSAQQMYFIQNGQVVLQSGVVTGNPNKGNATPQGVYSLAWKALDQVLRGTRQPDGTYEYETPVKYWMPFNGGIGFHDATWQSSFGGNRYQTHGSHGCVNLPYNIAGQLYQLISAGTPVVCHY